MVEYCFHGNLKDYVSRYREYYIDELCQDTREIQVPPAGVSFVIINIDNFLLLIL